MSSYIYTADVERTFSQLKLVNTRIRNQMTLDSLLQIENDHPAVSEFPVTEAVKRGATRKELMAIILKQLTHTHVHVGTFHIKVILCITSMQIIY